MKDTGFTLIELLVVITLVAVLSSLGLASYIDFNRSQIVTQAASKIVSDLRLAQSLAANSQKPDGDCGTLQGYLLEISGNSYTLNVNCANPAYDKNPVKSESVTDSLTVTGFSKVEFPVLKQPVRKTGGDTLQISGFGRTKTIIVGGAGEISLE